MTDSINSERIDTGCVRCGLAVAERYLALFSIETPKGHRLTAFMCADCCFRVLMPKRHNGITDPLYSIMSKAAVKQNKRRRPGGETPLERARRTKP